MTKELLVKRIERTIVSTGTGVASGMGAYASEHNGIILGWETLLVAPLLGIYLNRKNKTAKGFVSEWAFAAAWMVAAHYGTYWFMHMNAAAPH